MVERRDATMERNRKLPLSADSKTELLGKLKGTIHFEKTLTAISSVNGLANKSKLGLPAWFVQEYGDRFQKAVILRTESSTKSWPVKLTITFPTPRASQVVFSGGWKAFATFHGLLEGDSLVFSLTAMSEFEVYIFPGSGNPKRSPSQAPRKWSNGSKPSRKKAKQEPYENQDEKLAAEGGIEGAGTLDGLISEKKTVGEGLAVSPFGRCSTSYSISFHSDDLHLLESKNVLDSYSRGLHDSNKGQEPALDGDDLMVSSATRDGPTHHTSKKNFYVPDIEYQDLTLQIMITRNVSELPIFSKKLAVINIYCHEKGGKTACMEIPLGFCKEYGRRLHSVVKLQGIHEESEVRAVACLPSQNGGKQARLYLRAGWREFANENNLEAGDELLFALSADSFFIVRVVRPSREIAGPQDRV